MTANYYNARDVAQRIVNLLRTPAAEDHARHQRRVQQRLYTHDRSEAVRKRRRKRKSSSTASPSTATPTPAHGASRDNFLDESTSEGSEMSFINAQRQVDVVSPMVRKRKTSNMLNTSGTGHERLVIVGALEEDTSIELGVHRFGGLPILKENVVDLYSLSGKGGSAGSLMKGSREYERFSEFSDNNRRNAAAVKAENSYKKREKNDTSMRRSNKITYY